MVAKKDVITGSECVVEEACQITSLNGVPIHSKCLRGVLHLLSADDMGVLDFSAGRVADESTSVGQNDQVRKEGESTQMR